MDLSARQGHEADSLAKSQASVAYTPHEHWPSVRSANVVESHFIAKIGLTH
jgi:hypothetical protein